MKKSLSWLAALIFSFTSAEAISAFWDGAEEIRLEGNQVIVGYAHKFLPSNNNNTAPLPLSNATPIVFIPGFEMPNFDENGSVPLVPGDRPKGEQLLRKIGLSTGGNAIETLANTHRFAIYVIEFVDVNQSVATNSLVLERYLTAGATGPNQTFTSTGTRGAVIGFSMGGIIARHALTKLESEDRDHRTSLYVSVDSPHRGAFMPSSLEQLTRYLESKSRETLWGNIFNGDSLDKKLERGVEAYNSDAAKELLGLYVGFSAGNLNSIARLNEMSADHMKVAHPKHHALRNQILLYGGHPINLKSVAIAHGSFTGFPQQANGQNKDGNKLLRARVKLHNVDEVFKFILYNDAVTRKTKPCYVRVFDEKRRCAFFQSPPELASVCTKTVVFHYTRSSLADNVGLHDRLSYQQPDFVSFLDDYGCIS